MGNINHGYNLLSSLFFLNSTFYLPLIGYYSFHFSIIFFLVFFNFFLLKEIFSQKNNEVIIFLYILAFSFFNLSFNRIAEYGTDKPGQLLIVILVIKLFQILFFEDENKQILKVTFLLPLLALCISIKTYFLPYIILGISILILRNSIFNNIKKFFIQNLFIFHIYIINLFFSSFHIHRMYCFAFSCYLL